jgi:hypothetical protein
MNIQNQLLENYRTWLSNTLEVAPNSSIDILNKNGFPTSYSVSKEQLIEATLKAMMISNTFVADLNDLIIKHNQQSMQQFVSPNKMGNFAAQPEVMTIYNANNLTFGPQLQEPSNMTQIFEKAPLFVPNCKNC